MPDPTIPKLALVTGASRGIGAAIARRLAAEGLRVAVHYRASDTSAREVLASLEGDGHTLVQGDVADPDACERIVAEAAEALGGLELLVNNAGIFLDHPPTETNADAWRRAWRDTLATNLLGPVDLIYHALPHLRGGGRVVNVGSRGAFRGEPTAPAYGASKAGLHAAGQSLAVALAPHGIGVYTVAPGFVETDMASEVLEGASGEAIRAQSPFGRVARADEVAEVVAFLASGDTEFLSGGIVDVNGASYLRG